MVIRGEGPLDCYRRGVPSRGPRRRVLLALGLALGASACQVEVEGVPDGALARVDDVILYPEDVEQVHAQLGAYGKARFRGTDGRRVLLERVIDAEVLAQEADRRGLGDDPRVEWALVEEMATLYLSAELERRVPRERVAANEQALRDYYEAHVGEFQTPEVRRVRGAVFDRFDRANEALERYLAGEAELEELGDVFTTPSMTRDDHAFPGFHPIAFDPALKKGDKLPSPVASSRSLVVGYLYDVKPAQQLEFDDPAVQERLVNAVRAPLLREARAALLQELGEAHPAREP